jgi:hypothetical protein
VIAGANVSDDAGFPSKLPRLLGQKVAVGVDRGDDIMRILQKPFESIITQALLCFFFVTDLSAADEHTTVCYKELFRATVDPDERAFFDALVESMTFGAYVENRLASFIRERIVAVTSIVRFHEIQTLTDCFLTVSIEVLSVYC